MASLVNISTLAYLVLLAIALIILRKDKGLPQKDEFQGPICSCLTNPFHHRLSLIYESVQLANLVSLWHSSANWFGYLCLLWLQTLF